MSVQQPFHCNTCRLATGSWKPRLQKSFRKAGSANDSEPGLCANRSTLLTLPTKPYPIHRTFSFWSQTVVTASPLPSSLLSSVPPFLSSPSIIPPCPICTTPSSTRISRPIRALIKVERTRRPVLLAILNLPLLAGSTHLIPSLLPINWRINTISHRRVSTMRVRSPTASRLRRTPAMGLRRRPKSPVQVNRQVSSDPYTDG